MNLDNIASAQVSTSGNDDIDRAVRSGVLDCYATFGLRPAFYFIVNDPIYSMNAFAKPRSATGPFSDLVGEVGFGVPLLQASLHDDPLGYKAMYIIAHEFGHLMQFTLTYSNGHSLFTTLGDRQATHKWTELHADYVSGGYMADRYLRDTSQDMSVLMQTITGDTQFTALDHHGTTAERVGAFRAGFSARLAQSGSGADALRAVTYQGAAEVVKAFP